jgi:hypothetical protein
MSSIFSDIAPIMIVTGLIAILAVSYCEKFLEKHPIIFNIAILVAIIFTVYCVLFILVFNADWFDNWLNYPMPSNQELSILAKDQPQKMVIVNALLPLINQSRYLEKNQLSSQEIKGKVIISECRDNCSVIDDISIPSGLRADSTDPVITVFIINNRHFESVGTYTSGQKALQETTNLYMFYWPEKKAVGYATLNGKEPPFQIREGDSSKGKSVLFTVSDLIKSMPKS